MRRVPSFRVPSAALLLAGLLLALPGELFAQARFGAQEFKCVGAKQKAAGKYCQSALKAWSKWEKKQDATARDGTIQAALAKLSEAWGAAEVKSAKKGVDCVDQTVDAASAAASIDAAIADLVAGVNGGLDLGVKKHAICGSKLLRAAATLCKKWLGAESKHVKLIPKGGAEAKRAADQQKAAAKFAETFAKATAGVCPSTATESGLASVVESLASSIVYATEVAPGLDATQFQPISPVGPIQYGNLTLNPRCAFDADPDYHFFVKRGSVNKLVMYYQGGGACWENLTCSVPVCKDGADPVSDDPDNATSGFTDLSNPNNPFRDWNVVFVTYCSCDIHFGDIDQVYSGIFPDVTVRHRGFQNAKTVEKFARENFLAPEEVFVTGSSAGGYGALFHGPLLHEVWPAAQIHVLGDASNGVITSSFLQNEFSNWNFLANLPPDIPGVEDAISQGTGMVGYVETVAKFFPSTNWAHYTTAYDGGTGGQTGFYNVMLNGNDPLAALSWWNGSCAFNSVMVQQAADTFGLVPENYRYYIGTGSRHTMYGNDKIYTDQTGGESQTVVDWVRDMLAYRPGISLPTGWSNVTCSDCGIVLPGDPVPPTIPTPPFEDDGMGGVRIVCP
ncbi:MAG: pectin acetylesterase-family hydrolase [Myxococcota bacterium]